MKKKRKNILLVFGFLIGLSIILYPAFSNRWNAYRAKQLIASYSKAASEETKDPGHREEMLAAARAYNDGLKLESVPDAFSVRDGIRDEVYDGLLTVNEEGLMGSIEIPDIGETLPIYHYTTTESLEKGVGHLFGSSLPIGGESTHAILSAHRGLPSAKLFTDLPLLEIGDVFYIHVLDETLAYEVDQIQTVEPQEVSSLAIRKGEDLVTLITCTPYAVNTHRLLVRGHRITFTEEQYIEDRNSPPKKDRTQIFLQIVCAGIGILLAFVILWLGSLPGRLKRRRQGRRKRH